MSEPLPHADEHLRSAVFTALGAASVCWDGSNLGVFQSDRAKQIGDELVAEIRAITMWGQPQLGLATNADLIEELAARVRTGGIDPGYRTAGDD